MKHRSLLLFLFFFSLYGATSSGSLGLDSATRLEVTRNLLAGRGFTASGMGGVPGTRQGEPADYARFGIGQSVLLIPFELVVVRPLLSLAPDALHDRLRTLILALTFFPLFGALSLVLLERFLRDQGIDPKTSFRFVLVCGVATPLFCYGSAPYEVTQTLAFELAGLVMAGRGIQQNRRSLLWAGVGCFCLPTFLKPLAALDSLFLVGWTVWWICHRRNEPSAGSPRVGVRDALIAFVVIGILSVAWECWFNWVRFGSPFRSGYGVFFQVHQTDPFSNPFWKGLWGPLGSLDYGILWYCPLLLGVLGVIPQYRRLPKPLAVLFGLGGLLLLCLVVVLARYVAFAGNYSYGPRFEAHLIPFLLLPLIPLRQGHRCPAWLIVLVLTSFAVQVSWKSLSPRLEADQLCRSDEALFIEMTTLNPPGRWPQRLVNLGWKVTGSLAQHLEAQKGRPLTYIEQTSTEWDYFWVRGWKFGWGIGVATAALGMALSLVAGWSLVRLVRRYRTPETRQGNGDPPGFS